MLYNKGDRVILNIDYILENKEYLNSFKTWAKKHTNKIFEIKYVYKEDYEMKRRSNYLPNPFTALLLNDNDVILYNESMGVLKEYANPTKSLK
jgi:hypothetical protein